MKLYDYWRSSASYRVRIALHYKNLPFTLKEVHLMNNGGEQHLPSYTEKNPQGLVPCLELANGTLITQSGAILEYLEETHPTPSLLPQQPEDRAAVRMFAHIIGCDVHPLDNLRVLQYLTNTLHVDDADRSIWYRHWIEKGFVAFEALLQRYKGTYCFGDAFSLADVYLMPQIYNARRFHIPLEPYPLLQEVEHACLKLPCVQKALPEAQQKEAS